MFIFLLKKNPYLFIALLQKIPLPLFLPPTYTDSNFQNSLIKINNQLNNPSLTSQIYTAPLLCSQPSIQNSLNYFKIFTLYKHFLPYCSLKTINNQSYKLFLFALQTLRFAFASSFQHAVTNTKSSLFVFKKYPICFSLITINKSSSKLSLSSIQISLKSLSYIYFDNKNLLLYLLLCSGNK